MRKYDSSLGAMENTMPMDRVIDLKLDDMKDEEKERERRQNNIIIYNVPEKVVGKTDRIIVEGLIQHDLGVRDVIIEEVIKLGLGKEPRPILLKLHDTQTQRTVLSKARNLKQANTEASRNVYIVADKTPYMSTQREVFEGQTAARRAKRGGLWKGGPGVLPRNFSKTCIANGAM